jgi:hypothetical protein
MKHQVQRDEAAMRWSSGLRRCEQGVKSGVREARSRWAPRARRLAGSLNSTTSSWTSRRDFQALTATLVCGLVTRFLPVRPPELWCHYVE